MQDPGSRPSLGSLGPPFPPLIQDPGSMIQDPGSMIQDPGSIDPGSWIIDPGSWIIGPGSWIKGGKGGPREPKEGRGANYERGTPFSEKI